MTANIGTDVLAWWGAGLSTLLALVKIWEFWRDRFRVEVSHNFAGDPQIGNEVLIRNLSSRPFILTHWELSLCHRRWLRRVFTHISSASHDAGDRTVSAHSTCTLKFAEQHYFDWGWKSLNGRSIVIRLYVAGRKPILRLVYAP